MRSSGGFTLIELILVTVIIAVLAAMVVPVFVKRFSDSKVRWAKYDIAAFQSVIQLYALDNDDTYPKSLKDLSKPTGGRVYVKDVIKDPWGNDYLYVPGTDVTIANFKVYTAGPDGIPDNDDDVTSQTDVSTKRDAGSTS